MSLVVLGLSHHGAPLALLESVALPPEFASHADTNSSLRAVSSARHPSLPRGSAGMSYR